jgi:hypothetical protein
VWLHVREEPTKHIVERNIVVAGNRKDGAPQPPQERRYPLVLITLAAVRQIPARDHELRVDPLDQAHERRLEIRVVPGPEMQV